MSCGVMALDLAAALAVHNSFCGGALTYGSEILLFRKQMEDHAFLLAGVDNRELLALDQPDA